MIKEGQVIGYLDQFGTELPVKVAFSFHVFTPGSVSDRCALT